LVASNDFRPNQRPVSPAEPIICNIASPYLGRPITEVSPDYPKRALKAKIQGDVVLDLAVSEEGKVVSVSVLSGDPELSREAAKTSKLGVLARRG